MRQSDGLRPVYGLCWPVFALAGCPPHLPFFALTHPLRPCRYPYPADCPSSFDGSSLGHTSLHRLLFGSAVSVYPLTGFREVRLTRQQFSLNVAACTLARAADQSPPTLHADRPARLRQSLLQPESPPARVCYHYSAQPPIAETGFSPVHVSKNEGCTRRGNEEITKPLSLFVILVCFCKISLRLASGAREGIMAGPCGREDFMWG